MEERKLTCDHSGRREKRIRLRRKPRIPSGKRDILQDFTEENVWANEAAQLKRANEKQRTLRLINYETRRTEEPESDPEGGPGLDGHRLDVLERR